MTDIFRTTGIRIVIHVLWWVEGGDSPLLSDAARERIGSYVTRYAQTLGVDVIAAGGTADHLHLLMDLPPTKTLGEIDSELRRATTRFLRESLPGLKLFAWGEGVIESVSPWDVEKVAEYIRDNAARHESGDLMPEWEGEEGEPEEDDGSTPDWLRDAMEGRQGFDR